MQKKLIALAVAGLVSGGAFAQSNVTVSGNIGASVDSYSLSGATTARSTSRQNNVSDQSSAIILTGEEDLGKGLKAWFQIDSRFSIDRGNAGALSNSAPYPIAGLGNGNTAIGFKGAWGTVGIGRWDVHYDAFSGIENLTASPLAGRFGHFGLAAQINGAQVALGSRASNLVWYDSPSFSGFKARVGVSTNPAAGEGAAALVAGTGNPDPTDGRAYQIKLNYDNGPITAVYSYFNYKVEGRANYTSTFAVVAASGAIADTPALAAGPVFPADQKSSRLGGAYTFPFGLKVGLGWDRSTMAEAAAGLGDRTRTAWMLPISYTMGGHVFKFNYAKAGNTSGQVAGTGDTSAKEFLLGYAYNFSKRTAVGVEYITLTNQTAGTYNVTGASTAITGLTGNTAGEDSKLLSFNVRHFF